MKGCIHGLHGPRQPIDSKERCRHRAALPDSFVAAGTPAEMVCPDGEYAFGILLSCRSREIGHCQNSSHSIPFITISGQYMQPQIFQPRKRY